MKEHFRDPIAPKEGIKPIKGNPWNFSQPEYDERSSCYISAGTDFGTGFKTPVGTEGQSDKGSAIPKGNRRIDISIKK